MSLVALGVEQIKQYPGPEQVDLSVDPQLLSDYAFLHYNYKYDWLRPTLEEIIAAYKKLYAHNKGSTQDDSDSDGNSDGSSDEGESEAEGEEEGEEDADLE